MKKLLPLLILLIAFKSNAQLTLTDSYVPTVNSRYYTVMVTSSVTEGAAGENVTWDFSDITTDNGVIVDVSPMSELSGALADYPEAEYALLEGDNDVRYFSSSAGEILNWGYYFPTFSNAEVIYDDPQKWLEFPFTYGDSFQDSLKGSGSILSYTGVRKGKTIVEADAFGTLLLPDGMVHNNVLRVKSIITTRDSASFMGSPIIVNSTTTSYLFYAENIPYEIFSITYVTTNGSPQAPIITYSTPYITSTKKENASVIAEVYPNPSNDYINIKSVASESFKFYLKDLTGKIILQGSESRIDVSVLKKGIYLLEIETDKGSTTEKIIIQ